MSDALQHPKRATKVSYKEPPLPRASLVIWIIGIGLLILLLWAGLFQLEEVSTGTGKVIPSSKEQVIQSLDGGILTKLDVQEGDIVEKGQVLAQLDPTRFESNVGESQSLLISAQATAARLRAEVNGTPLVFPDEVKKDPKLVQEETALYNSRRENLEQSISGLKLALQLVQQELTMTEPLVAKGAASEVEVLRLKREANDLQNKIN
ncbi:biotin/lipoyl-binding protein, partial [Acinetobacter ursingii]